MNSFYASVECLCHPEVRDKLVAAAGDVEARHGIILAKNQHAKRLGATVSIGVSRNKIFAKLGSDYKF